LLPQIILTEWFASSEMVVMPGGNERGRIGESSRASNAQLAGCICAGRPKVAVAIENEAEITARRRGNDAFGGVQSCQIKGICDATPERAGAPTSTGAAPAAQPGQEPGASASGEHLTEFSEPFEPITFQNLAGAKPRLNTPNGVPL
jgi:hypothetical protein